MKTSMFGIPAVLFAVLSALSLAGCAAPPGEPVEVDDEEVTVEAQLDDGCSYVCENYTGCQLYCEDSGGGGGEEDYCTECEYWPTRHGYYFLCTNFGFGPPDVYACSP